MDTFTRKDWRLKFFIIVQHLYMNSSEFCMQNEANQPKGFTVVTTTFLKIAAF